VSVSSPPLAGAGRALPRQTVLMHYEVANRPLMSDDSGFEEVTDDELRPQVTG